MENQKVGNSMKKVHNQEKLLLLSLLWRDGKIIACSHAIEIDPILWERLLIQEREGIIAEAVSLKK